MGMDEDVQVLPHQDRLQESLGGAEPRPILCGCLHVHEPMAGLCKVLKVVNFIAWQSCGTQI